LLTAAFAGCNATGVVSPPQPAPQHSIQHIIIMMQENRSFNNIFAGFPGAQTALSGPCRPKGQAAKWCPADHMIALHSVHLRTGTPDFGIDIDHSHSGFQIECNLNASNVCAMDGFNLIRYGESGQSGFAKT
jgi:hypothetical protein